MAEHTKLNERRHPVGVAVTPNGLVIVVCSDGAVFAAKEGLNFRWEKEQAIPGTPAAELSES